MNVIRRSLLGALSVGALLAASPPADAAPRARFVEGEVIVKFKRPLSPAAMASVTQRGNGRATIVRRAIDPWTGAGEPRTALSRFPRTTSVEAMVMRLRSLPEVEYAEPNYVVSLSEPRLSRSLGTPQTVTRRVGRTADGRALTRITPAADIRALATTYPTDPNQLLQWGWTWISADIVWPDSRSSEVAVVDTGVDPAHPDLSGVVINGYDYINGDGVPNDDNGHGTHVAGIIAAKANNKTGFAGVARSKIYAVKVLDAAGTGTYFDIAQGIRKAADRLTVKVINVSLGGTDVSQTLEDAVDYAVMTRGKLLVAAAGNESQPGQPPVSTPFYPAAYSEIFPERVLAVAASGVSVTGSGDAQTYFVEGCRADYSNWGDYVNITAPGTDIYSTQPWKKEFYNNRYFGDDADLDGYEYLSGTSMAAPHVAAVAARVQANNAAFTNVDVFRRLLDRGFDSQVGTPIDVDGDSIDDLTECWESSAVPFTPLLAPAFKDVDAALSLGRARVTGRLLDATTGLGLTGATPALLRGSAPTGYGGTIGTVGTSFFELVNVPWSDQTGVGPVTPPYRLRVIKSRYTPSTGSIVEDYAVGDPQKPGIDVPFGSLEVSLRQISLPPNSSRYTFVADWGDWNGGGYLASSELDLHVFRPRADDFDAGCSIGYFDLVGLGGCGDPDSIGTLVTYPYARWMRDGGPTDGLGSESTVLHRLLSTASLPTQPDNRYRVFLSDATFFDGTGFLEQDAYPVVRLWRSGVVRATIRFDTAFVDPSCVSEGGATPCDFWNIGSLSSSGAFTLINTVGDTSAFPYAPPGGGGGGSGSRSPRPSRMRTGSTVAGSAGASGATTTAQP